MAVGACSVEGLGVNVSPWAGKRIFLTGHTGFKGGWLSLWLSRLGARVHGYALQPPTDPSLFVAARLQERLASSTIADLRDRPALRAAMLGARPDLVLHLAAQPLVRESYRQPLETLEVNVLGTANVLDEARRCEGVLGVLVVTSDKCYENSGQSTPFVETDPMGGHDPYSASKGCAELVTASWRRSFLSEAGILCASARAGNVIGGGDWAADRLVPDFLRASAEGRVLAVRSPAATRPWQHVLEPLAGYMALAERLLRRDETAVGGWNFGPDEADCVPVRKVADALRLLVPGSSWQAPPVQHPHEAAFLTLDSAKARDILGWRPRWRLDEALRRTVEWHDEWRRGGDAQAMADRQIDAYSNAEAIE